MTPNIQTLSAPLRVTSCWRKTPVGLLSALGIAGILGGTLAGCGSDTTGPPPRNATQAYWALRLQYHAVALALTPPYDTVQLTATPVNAAGAPLPGLGPVTYQSGDSLVGNELRQSVSYLTSAGGDAGRHNTHPGNGDSIESGDFLDAADAGR